MNKLTGYVAKNVLTARKALWRLTNDYSPDAKAIFVLGVQRSGTTMLIDCLNKSVETEVLGEVSRAMDNFRLKDTHVIADIIKSCPAKAIVFKPLTDSHRARELLDMSPNVRICWSFRRASDRANSAVAKFGSNNLELLTAFTKGEMMDTWQAQGMSQDSLDLIRSFDVESMTPHSAAGLFWVIRNNMFFEMGLDKESRVLPISYEDLVSNPKTIMRGVCNLSGIRYDDKLVSSIHTKSVGKEQSRLDPEIKALCDEMYARFHALQQDRWSALNL
jgi:hypothetical protein